MDTKSVRVFFSKHGDARYISHLDLSRFMQRALKRAGLPLWHTEGFNPHPYLTFALPLSVGQAGENESMDFRLTEDMPFDEIAQRVSGAMPNSIVIKGASEPIYKAKEIECADYDVELFECSDLAGQAECFFAQEHILAEKKSKKGVFKQIDIAPMIFGHKVGTVGDRLEISLTLATGSEQNLNPALVIKALGEYCKTDFCPIRITRTKIMTFDGSEFK